MAIRGVFNSNQSIVGDRLNSFESTILRIDPSGNAPMLALSSGMKEEVIKATEFSWVEEPHLSGRTAVVAGGTTTSVDVADASMYTVKTIVQVDETGEQMYITAITNNNLTVIRGFAGTTVVSVNAANNIQRVGNAFEEGSNPPEALVNQGYVRSNVCQIFRNGWAITGSADAIAYNTVSSRMADNKQQCMQFHAEDRERSMIWGRRDIRVVSGAQLRVSSGVIDQIEKYGGIVQAAGATTSMAQFRDFLRRVFETNVRGQPNERIAFCGSLALQVLTEAARRDSTYQIQGGETEFGFKFTTFISPFGTLVLKTHPLFVENPVFSRNLLVVHPGALMTKFTRKTEADDYDAKGNRAGIDAKRGYLLTECGVCLQAATVNGIFTGLTASAASA